MTCTYESPDGSRCQFQDGKLAQYRGEPIYFDGKWWCRFHLPAWHDNWKVLRDEYGPSPKSWWPGDKEDAFVSAVREIMRAGDERDAANLVGLVLPGGFDGRDLRAVIFADFSHACIGPRTQFHAVAFGNHVRFTGARFGKMVDFREAKFGDGIDWRETQFDDHATFNGTQFGKATLFDGARFGDHATFSGAWFKELTGFTNAQFGGTTRFDGAFFEGMTSFAHAYFRANVNFAAGGTDPADSPWGFRTDVFRSMNFRNAIFGGDVSFTNRRFQQGVTFSGAIFARIPDFHGADLHQDTDFQGASFNVSGWRSDGEASRAERAYRTLKLAMAEQHASNEQARFFAYELECRRQQRSAPLFSRLMAALYKYGSDYGRSMLRPLAWWVVLFGYAVLALTALQALDGVVVVSNAVLEMFQQSVRPFFGLLEEGYTPAGEMNSLREAHPWLFRVIVFVYSLLEIGCLSLFVLAVRRHFRLG